MMTFNRFSIQWVNKPPKDFFVYWIEPHGRYPYIYRRICHHGNGRDEFASCLDQLLQAHSKNMGQHLVYSFHSGHFHVSLSRFLQKHHKNAPMVLPIDFCIPFRIDWFILKIVKKINPKKIIIPSTSY